VISGFCFSIRFHAARAIRLVGLHELDDLPLRNIHGKICFGVTVCASGFYRVDNLVFDVHKVSAGRTVLVRNDAVEDGFLDSPL